MSHKELCKRWLALIFAVAILLSIAGCKEEKTFNSMMITELEMPEGTVGESVTASNEYYVSPNGSDQNPGTKEEPFRSIYYARDVVRKMKNSVSGDITVYLGGGYNKNSFSYPLYLAYQGKHFRKLAALYDKFKQLQVPTYGYIKMWNDKQITREQYEILMAPYEAAKEEYYAYLDAEWEDYLALTKQDLPQFYAYSVIIDFTDINNLGAKWDHEESFTQIEVTIGDQTYVQDVGKITLIEDWQLPAQLDWEAGFAGIAGTIGSIHGPRLYNDGLHCLEVLYRYTADRYELLEELVMQNPAQTVERVWLQIRPKGGKTVVVEWDMSEPYEIYPGDEVTVYAACSDENLSTLRYQTVIAAYLLCSSDGESYCRMAYCDTVAEGSDYLWYAILFDGLDLESYYWDYYYLINEPWRYDPEGTPVS